MNNIVTTLEVVLADTYALFLKTQNYHWNVEGPNFKMLHEMFESQYDDLFKAIDTIAELIRELGHKTIGTFEDFVRLTHIKSGDKNSTTKQMLEDLLHDNELLEKTLFDALKVAQEMNDEVVAAFLGERMSIHRKNVWILKSTAQR